MRTSLVDRVDSSAVCLAAGFVAFSDVEDVETRERGVHVTV